MDWHIFQYIVETTLVLQHFQEGWSLQAFNDTRRNSATQVDAAGCKNLESQVASLRGGPGLIQAARGELFLAPVAGENEPGDERGEDAFQLEQQRRGRDRGLQGGRRQHRGGRQRARRLLRDVPSILDTEPSAYGLSRHAAGQWPHVEILQAPSRKF